MNRMGYDALESGALSRLENEAIKLHEEEALKLLVAGTQLSRDVCLEWLKFIVDRHSDTILADNVISNRGSRC